MLPETGALKPDAARTCNQTLRCVTGQLPDQTGRRFARDVDIDPPYGPDLAARVPPYPASVQCGMHCAIWPDDTKTTAVTRRIASLNGADFSFYPRAVIKMNARRNSRNRCRRVIRPAKPDKVR